MTNKQFKDKINEIKKDIENGKLYLEKYSKENFSEFYQDKKPKKLPKIIYRFLNNSFGRFEMELMLFNSKGYYITIFIGTNFSITRRKKLKKDKRNRFREVDNEFRTLLLEKTLYHKNLYKLEILTDYKLYHTKKDILNFFDLSDTKDFELILLKLVKELILKKELKELN